MKLRKGLILREVAGQFVIVPTGAAVREVTDIVYISSSAAYLWNYMEEHEFEQEELTEQILEHYTGVTREQAGADVEAFLKVLKDHNILDDNARRGKVYVRLSGKANMKKHEQGRI